MLVAEVAQPIGLILLQMVEMVEAEVEVMALLMHHLMVMLVKSVRAVVEAGLEMPQIQLTLWVVMAVQVLLLFGTQRKGKQYDQRKH